MRATNRYYNIVRLSAFSLIFALTVAFYMKLWNTVPDATSRHTLFAMFCGVLLVSGLWTIYLKRRITNFSQHLCETLDTFIAGRQPQSFTFYDDSLTTKIEGKLMQYYNIMEETKEQSMHDKKTLQELVSDISHQLKTPIANVKMFTGILKEHTLAPEKQEEFLNTMEVQINKLDFLIQSLIKISRLEAGTFAIHLKEASLYNTIAQAISGVWARVEEKNIALEVECSPDIIIIHDPKWTAEALMNILDNSVKYTPKGGCIKVLVRPWQFYTRIDITDTGMGIPEKDYHQIFKRFYRTEKTTTIEGVGLGLYLAQGIITRQKGYITVKSKVSEGSTFTVYLLSK